MDILKGWDPGNLGQQAEFVTGVSPSNFIGVFDGPETVSAPGGVVAGSYIGYQGQVYRWDGGRWLDINGIGADIPIYFMRDPFANAEPSEWGKPLPLWGNGAVSSGAVPALASHNNNIQLLEVTALLERNTELEIPLLDDEGNPYLDPAIPPVSMMRSVSGATDRVTSPTTVGVSWTDRYSNLRPYIGNNESVADNEAEDPMLSHVFRIEKTPVPHWVIRITHANNKLTSSSGSTLITSAKRNVLIHCLGGFATKNTSQSVEVGSSGVSGHYRVQKTFYPDAGHSSTGSLLRANQPVMVHDGAYVASGASTTTIQLTDDGLSTGTDWFSTSYVPFIRVLGDREWQVDRAGTETNYKMSSLGMGFAQGGIWPGHNVSGSLAIQHPDFDEYGTETRLVLTSSCWTIQIDNMINTTNSAGLTISATGGTDAWSRYYAIYGIGRKP